MGMLYAWATPEYMLWNMTIGQLFLLHNEAVDLRTPRKPGEVDHSTEDLRDRRDEIRQTFPELREMWEKKYGDVEHG